MSNKRPVCIRTGGNHNLECPPGCGREPDDEAERVQRVRDAAPELLEALKACQFGFNNRRCVVCAGWNMSPYGETDYIHTPRCIVGRAIAKAGG